MSKLVAKHIKQTYGVPLVLIVDNISIHRGRKMSDWQQLLEDEYSMSLYFLPPYSPDLNRIEMVWRQMKYRSHDFQVEAADQIHHWVEQVPAEFGIKYKFTF